MKYFITLCIVHNQQRILKCGGLETVVNCLHRAVNRLPESENSVQLALCLTNAFDAIVTDYGKFIFIFLFEGRLIMQQYYTLLMKLFFSVLHFFQPT